jgi:hypothetical protein
LLSFTIYAVETFQQVVGSVLDEANRLAKSTECQKQKAVGQRIKFDIGLASQSSSQSNQS